MPNKSWLDEAVTRAPRKRERVGNGSPKANVIMEVNLSPRRQVDTLEHYLELFGKIQDLFASICFDNPCYVFSVKTILDTPDLFSQIYSAYRMSEAIPFYAVSSNWINEIREIVSKDSQYTEDRVKAAIESLQPPSYRSQVTKVSVRIQSNDEVACMLDIAEQCLEMHSNATYVVTDDIFLSAACKEKRIQSLTLEDLRNKLDRVSFWAMVWRNPRKAFADREIDWGTLLDEETYSLGRYMTYDDFCECNPLDDERYIKLSASAEQNAGVVSEETEVGDTQELDLDVSDAVKKWVNNNLTIKKSWDWFGLIYILFKTGQLGENFNAEKAKKILNEAFPDVKTNVPSKISAASSMLYTDIVNNWALVENAEEVWMKASKAIHSKDFGDAAAKASFSTIRELLPSFANSFQDKFSWK